jgi:hypothetical protein
MGPPGPATGFPLPFNVTHNTTIQLSIDCIVVSRVTTITEYILINSTMGVNHFRINHLGLV